MLVKIKIAQAEAPAPDIEAAVFIDDAADGAAVFLG